MFETIFLNYIIPYFLLYTIPCCQDLLSKRGLFVYSAYDFCISVFLHMCIFLSPSYLHSEAHIITHVVHSFQSRLIHISHSMNPIFTRIVSLLMSVLKGVHSYCLILPYITISPALLDLAVPWRQAPFMSSCCQDYPENLSWSEEDLDKNFGRKSTVTDYQLIQNWLRGLHYLKKKINLKWNQYSIP